MHRSFGLCGFIALFPASLASWDGIGQRPEATGCSDTDGRERRLAAALIWRARQ